MEFNDGNIFSKKMNEGKKEVTKNFQEIFFGYCQRYTYRVRQTIQMKLIRSCVWDERALLGRAKTALKFKNRISIG